MNKRPANAGWMVTLLLAACMVAGTGSASALSQASVEQLVQSVEAAAARNDVEGQAAHFSDDIVIKLVMPKVDGGTDISTSTKAEFIRDQLNAVRDVPSHRYTSTLEEVEINPEGRRAMAQVQSSSSYTQDGSQYVLEAGQAMIIELRDGVPKIVAVTSTVTGIIVDGRKVF